MTALQTAARCNARPQGNDRPELCPPDSNPSLLRPELCATVALNGDSWSASMFRSVVAVLCCCTVASRKLAVRPPPQSVPGWLEQGHGTREGPRTLPLVPEIGSASPGTLRWESAVNRHNLRPHRDARPMQPIMTLLNGRLSASTAATERRLLRRGPHWC
jgi:hypothetical protein